MISDDDFTSTSTQGLFFKFLLPALLTVVTKSVLIVADGMLIANGVGHLGLATVGLSMPIHSLFGALAMVVGLGGAATMSMRYGEGDERGAKEIFKQSLTFILGLVSFFVVFGLLFLPQLVSYLGATGELATYATDFLGIMFFFYLFHPIVIVITFFVFNDRNPHLPMYSMLIGLITHLALDYLLLFELAMGIKGAALAALMSQFVMLAILMVHFYSGKGILSLALVKLKLDEVKQVIKIGSPLMSLEIATIIAMVIFNYVLLNDFSELHLAAFGITMNLGVVLLFFLGGVGQACQPIISYCFGANDKERVRETLILGIQYSLGLAVVFALIVLMSLDYIIPIYSEGNAQLTALAQSAASLYFIAAPFIAFNLIGTTLFQAIGHATKANIISVCRALVFILIAIFILPQVFPQDGIWSLTLFAELFTAIITGLFIVKFLQSYEQQNSLTQTC